MRRQSQPHSGCYRTTDALTPHPRSPMRGSCSCRMSDDSTWNDRPWPAPGLRNSGREGQRSNRLAERSSDDVEVLSQLPGCVLAARGVGAIMQLHRELIDRLANCVKREAAVRMETTRSQKLAAITAHTAGASVRSSEAIVAADAAMEAFRARAAEVIAERDAAAPEAASAPQEPAAALPPPPPAAADLPMVQSSAERQSRGRRSMRVAAHVAASSGGASSGAPRQSTPPRRASGGALMSASRFATPLRMLQAAEEQVKGAMEGRDLADRVAAAAVVRLGAAKAAPGARGRRQVWRGGRVALSSAAGSAAGAPSAHSAAPAAPAAASEDADARPPQRVARGAARGGARGGRGGRR